MGLRQHLIMFSKSTSKYLLYLNSGDEFFSTLTIKNILPFLEENKSLYCFSKFGLSFH